MSREKHRKAAPDSLPIAVITVSDTRTPESDESGALIRELCEKAGHTIANYRIVQDDCDRIRWAVSKMLGSEKVAAVLLSGGTGVSRRDMTFEAVDDILERRLDGYGELFRHLSFLEIGPSAMLSRAVGGVASGKPVFTMPGSTAAVRLAMEKLILPELGHVAAEASRKT